MKSRFMMSVLSICILLTVSGCGVGAEDSESTVDESVETEVDTEGVGETVKEESQEKSEEESEEESQEKSEEPEEDSEEKPEEGLEAPNDESMGTADEMESPREEGLEEESPREDRTLIPEQYLELITTATECIEGKAEEGSEDYDFSYMIYWYGAYYGASMRLGYLIRDIDGNGTDELIFGQNDEPDSAWNGVIYDLYTLSDGELIHVFSGGERSTYHLCENGLIANEGADGAALSTYAYYSFEGTELHLVEAVLYSGWDYPDNPWFYSTQTDSCYDVENAEPVNEEQARAVIDKYVYVPQTFIPFVEENDGDENTN